MVNAQCLFGRHTLRRHEPGRRTVDEHAIFRQESGQVFQDILR